MKKSAISVLFILATLLISGFTFAQIAIPSLQGTWECSISGKDTGWGGQADGLTQRGVILYIYQTSYEANVPNLSAVPEDDPADPFEGFVQGNQFSLYKNNQHGDPNVGREIIVGKMNKKGNTLTGKGTGFDSNTDWGSVWSYTFHAKKVSDTVP